MTVRLEAAVSVHRARCLQTDLTLRTLVLTPVPSRVVRGPTDQPLGPVNNAGKARESANPLQTNHLVRISGPQTVLETETGGSTGVRNGYTNTGTTAEPLRLSY